MFTFENYDESARYISRLTNSFQPETLLILGSGLGYLSDAVEKAISIDYASIPFFKTSTAPGHQGCLVFGTLEGKRVALMQGRFHYYEGYNMEEIAFPIRVLYRLGAKSLIVTNAAGCINEDWNAGDLMLIEDHIKLFLDSPLRGPNISEFGVRFPDSSHLYTPRLQKIALQEAEKNNIQLRKGVYFFFPGPQYETPAEIRAARILGGDAAGMSTVPEVIAASHCGMEVLGISLLSNMASGILNQPLTEEEVFLAGESAKPRFSKIVLGCLHNM
jgi:purine-nucleoside phosphorylase